MSTGSFQDGSWTDPFKLLEAVQHCLLSPPDLHLTLDAVDNKLTTPVPLRALAHSLAASATAASHVRRQ